MLQLRSAGPPGVAFLLQEKIWPGYAPIWLGDGGPVGIDSSFNLLYPQVFPHLFTDPMSPDQRELWRRRWFGTVLSGSIQSVPTYNGNAQYSMDGAGNCPTINTGVATLQQQEGDGPLPPLVPGISNCIFANTYSWGGNTVPISPSVSNSVSDWTTDLWTNCRFNNGSFKYGQTFEFFSPVPFADHLATAYTRIQARSFPTFTAGVTVSTEHFNEYDWDSTSAQPPGPGIADVARINSPWGEGGLGNDSRGYKRITLLNPSDYDGTPVSGLLLNDGEGINLSPLVATDWANLAGPDPFGSPSLATGWIYESNEGDAQFNFINSVGLSGVYTGAPLPSSRFWVWRASYNPSGTSSYFIARAKIVPMQRMSGGNSAGEHPDVAPSADRFSDVEVVTIGNTSTGTPIEIPSPQSLGGGNDFNTTVPSSGVYNGIEVLSVGEMCFMVLGETPDQWAARTGCPIRSPGGSGASIGSGSGSHDNTGQ